MKYASSFQELDTLGEGLSKDYLKKAKKQNPLPFDIEGFITGYLGMTIVYESFAEQDSSKIGFLADGQHPLLVYRNGTACPVIFPENTIKEMDPGSTLTWYTVRKLCKNKKIRNVEAGNKLLVDLDDLIDFLNCEKRIRK